MRRFEEVEDGVVELGGRLPHGEVFETVVFGHGKESGLLVMGCWLSVVDCWFESPTRETFCGRSDRVWVGAGSGLRAGSFCHLPFAIRGHAMSREIQLNEERSSAVKEIR